MGGRGRAAERSTAKLRVPLLPPKGLRDAFPLRKGSLPSALGSSLSRGTRKGRRAGAPALRAQGASCSFSRSPGNGRGAGVGRGRGGEGPWTVCGGEGGGRTGPLGGDRTCGLSSVPEHPGPWSELVAAPLQAQWLTLQGTQQAQGRRVRGSLRHSQAVRPPRPAPASRKQFQPSPQPPFSAWTRTRTGPRRHRRRPQRGARGEGGGPEMHPLRGRHLAESSRIPLELLPSPSFRVATLASPSTVPARWTTRTIHVAAELGSPCPG